jgi:hypothetical protein
VAVFDRVGDGGEQAIDLGGVHDERLRALR